MSAQTLWLDKLDNRWPIGRIKDHVALVNGFPFDSECFSEITGVRLVRIRDLTDGGDFTYVNAEVPASAMIDSGDVIVGMDGAFNAVVWNGGPAALNQRLCVLRARASLDQRFLGYLLAMPLKAINDITYFTTVKHLSSSDLLSERIPLPPLVSQRAIADYLDRETARIDALIAAKQRTVVLLEERRHSARETLVSEARRADSHIRLGYLMREVDDRLGSADPPPLLSVSIHHGVVPFADANPDRVPRADDLGNYKRCIPDDIVLNRMRAFQGGIGRATIDGIVSPDYAVLRPSSRGWSGYLNHLLRSPWFVGQMERLLRGIGGVEQGNVRTPRVNWDDLRMVVVPAPSIETQILLAHELEFELNQSWEVLKVIERQIVIIQEHRQALIAATVTGQLDILEAS